MAFDPDIDKSLVKGKCGDCDDKKPLDEMVRKDSKKGLYHCIDCHVEDIRDKYESIMVADDTDTIKKDNLGRLFKWIFG